MNTLPNSNKHIEAHSNGSGQKLNWLRAAVLGANDGIVSTASLVVGVAGATNSSTAILTAGIAGLVAGALSMGVGEYISVSTQRDTELALIAKETDEIKNNPDFEKQELTKIYQNKGLSEQTARLVAEEFTASGALLAHLDAELGIDPKNLTDPWHAAYASAGAFLAGAVVPIIMVIVSPANFRIPITFFAVFVALSITGSLSAYVGGASKTKATIRVVVGGMLAMLVTFGIGKLFGVAGI